MAIIWDVPTDPYLVPTPTIEFAWRLFLAYTLSARRKALAELAEHPPVNSPPDGKKAGA